MKPFVLIWGGGDLATGVAMRLHRVGIPILMIETAQPKAVRRSVAFAQAIYDGETTIENIKGCLVSAPEEIEACWQNGIVPVMIDPDLDLIKKHKPLIIVDARMRKRFVPLSLDIASLIIGLGPGFTAGVNCHAAIETNRGHFLGRVFWQGSPEPSTGVPMKVGEYDRERVLYAPGEGYVHTFVDFGDKVNKADLLLKVADQEVRAPFSGIVRGLIHPGVWVKKGTKLGDIDPRSEDFRCWTVSDKSLAIGGGVLEAILTRSEIRAVLMGG